MFLFVCLFLVLIPSCHVILTSRTWSSLLGMTSICIPVLQLKTWPDEKDCRRGIGKPLCSPLAAECKLPLLLMLLLSAWSSTFLSTDRLSFSIQLSVQNKNPQFHSMKWSSNSKLFQNSDTQSTYHMLTVTEHPCWGNSLLKFGKQQIRQCELDWFMWKIWVVLPHICHKLEDCTLAVPGVLLTNGKLFAGVNSH